MVNALSDVDSNILDCKKSIEEFDNSILELHWEIFQRIQTKFGNISSELSNLAGLFDKFNDIRISDGKGTWTNQAIATLGLYVQQYEVAKYQVDQYSNAINKLKQDYADGRYSATEYLDRLADLTQEQWRCIDSAESLEDAIYKLNETRINEEIKVIEDEIDSYDELTQSQIKALKASKDLHDYENSVVEKTKAITDLERQIAAMANDTSANTIAKRKKLEEQLSEAKKDLEETEYQHSIEVQEEALNKQFEQYEKERNDEINALRESLNDRETILAESFATVKENASLIGQEIANIAVEHGITVSNTLISSWQAGGNAIAGYGEILSQNTSAFIANIMGVENEMWNLQANANNTANTLAWMFSTKADNLVSELNSSYFAESNLNMMTQVLQNSLINTLERGYNVTSITNALGNIESAAKNAKDAVDALNNTPYTNGGSGSSNTANSSGISGSGQSTSEIINKILEDKKDRVNNLRVPSKNNHKGGGSSTVTTTYAHLNAYADGTRNAKGGIIVKDEEGIELELMKLRNGKFGIASDGSQIFTKEQTDNLYEMSKKSPEKLTSDITLDMWRRSNVPEPVIDKRVDNNTSIQVGSLITVHGSIDSSNVKQMQKIADQAVEKFERRINECIVYGR